ncbi:uncharacterized protein [Nicotiana sylvestris]|uniref:uncharacterized protein n=1 Tax=Nicotiana sylvestris TaxID=4096 RepID=UPI00388CBFB5
MAIDMDIQELLVIDDSDLLVYQVQREWATKNSKILPYLHHVQKLRKRFTKIEFRHIPKIQNEFSNALATLSSMIQHPNKNYINPIPVRIHNQSAYFSHVEEETNGKPWFHDIKEYLAKGEYPGHVNYTQKRTLWRLSNLFFHNGGNLYRRTPDLGLLRCVDAKESSKLLEDVHAGTCGPHMNVLADMIKVPPNKLNATSLPCPSAARGMDVIGPIEPTTSNGHRFILVAIDYFTKWLEFASYKVVTKKIIVDFVKDHSVCRFGVPESIVTDNAVNLNSDVMKTMCETFKIKYKNSIAYRPQMNEAIEGTNKNIKKILRRMVENHKQWHEQWHEKLSFALLGYCTTVHTSTGATPYMLVYGTCHPSQCRNSFFKDHTRS